MKKIAYTDAPPQIEKEMSESRILDVSLDDLIKRSKKERITIMIDSENLDFFRTQAKKHGVPYQTMINNSLTATRSAIQKQAAQ